MRGFGVIRVSLMLAALASPAAAQTPGLGADPAAAGAGGVGAAGGGGAAGLAGTAAPAAPKTLWTFLGCKPKPPGTCREKLCKIPLFRLLSGFVAPVSGISGGIIPPLCNDAKPNPSDLAKPATSAEGASARIKADQAGAKARRDAVKQLAGVDCSRWPEAEEALINALRSDRNECVRFEAARVLAGGCCCTRKTIEALRLSASGARSKKDPPENSRRVRHAAAVALAHCESCADPALTKPPQPERPPRPEAPPSPPPEPAPPIVQSSVAPVGRAAPIQPVQFIRQEQASASSSPAVELVPIPLDNAAAPAPPAAAAAPPPAAKSLPTGRRSLFQVFRNSVGGGSD